MIVAIIRRLHDPDVGKTWFRTFVCDVDGPEELAAVQAALDLEYPAIAWESPVE